jgi:predicted alpha-1,2-mannosidase
LLKQIKRCLATCLQVLLFLAVTLQSNTFLIVAQQPETGQKLISLVDPFIGTDNGGNTVPGAAIPFGFANPSPDTLRHDTSGYDSAQPIIGFSQTHVSGTGGGSKYGNFRVTPQVGEINLGDLASPKADERASPGYYAVTLTRPRVRVELTATRLVAVHRYTFPASDKAHLLLDVSSVVIAGGEAQQHPLECTARVVGTNRLEGTGKFAGGWNPSPYTLHFAAEFDRPFDAYGTEHGKTIEPNATVVKGEKERVGLFVQFDTRQNHVVQMKIAVSFISIEQARANLKREVGARSFDEVRARAEAAWEKALSKIIVEGGTESERRIFYTALYRSQYMPHELTGENVWWKSSEPHYEDYYCLWDTFRTLHPLLTLIQPDRQRDMVRSLIDTYVHTGWMPDARIAGANGLTQGGSNADVLIADAFVKGLKGIDYHKAYESMLKNAEVDSPRPVYEGREVEEYKRLGYLSLKHERSVSRTLEYAYDDFCVAQVAAGLGKHEDARLYLERSKNWMNLWDDETQTVRPRHPDGRWMMPYSPTKIYSLDREHFTWWGAPYYEGSGYQYSTYVPHDVQGLINKLGGDTKFVAWLDRFFNKSAASRAEIDGLYTQGNEPDILAPYLYIHAGRPDRTEEQVRYLLTTEYKEGRDGLPGNDDAGTMSSWYVWNAVGLYPNAGQSFYYIGSPLFRRTEIRVGLNQIFIIEARETSATNKYIQSATLNGRPLNRAWLRHAEIIRGGKLILQMSDKPSQWARLQRPPSISGVMTSPVPQMVEPGISRNVSKRSNVFTPPLSSIPKPSSSAPVPVRGTIRCTLVTVCVNCLCSAAVSPPRSISTLPLALPLFSKLMPTNGSSLSSSCAPISSPMISRRVGRNWFRLLNSSRKVFH